MCEPLVLRTLHACPLSQLYAGPTWLAVCLMIGAVSAASRRCRNLAGGAKHSDGVVKISDTAAEVVNVDFPDSEAINVLKPKSWSSSLWRSTR